MKKSVFILFITGLLMIGLNGNSQNYYTNGTMKPDSGSTAKMRSMLGMGIGINSLTGVIGFRADLGITNNILMDFGLGSGSWGSKFSAGLSFMPIPNRGWRFGLGFSHVSGYNDFEPELEVGQGSSVEKKKVKMDLLPCNNLNIYAGYNVPFGKHMVFISEFGYSLLLTGDTYRIKDGSQLSDNGKTTMRIMQPGGIILGVGLAYAF